MTEPETCGMEGGAISLWFRVISCRHDSAREQIHQLVTEVELLVEESLQQ